MTGISNITISPLVGNSTDLVSPSSKVTLSVTASSVDGDAVRYAWQVRELY